MSVPTISTYTERQNRALKRTVDSLIAAMSRTESCYQHLRQHARQAFQGQILICIPTSEAPEPSADHPGTFPGWAYSLSQGGVGFVSLSSIQVSELFIGLHRPDRSIRWLKGRIVRVRPIPEEDFIDYGVAFHRHSTRR